MVFFQRFFAHELTTISVEKILTYKTALDINSIWFQVFDHRNVDDKRCNDKMNSNSITPSKISGAIVTSSRNFWKLIFSIKKRTLGQNKTSKGTNYTKLRVLSKAFLFLIAFANLFNWDVLEL